MSSHKPRWRPDGFCYTCQKGLTDKRHSRDYCSVACFDVSEVNHRAALSRAHASLRRFYASRPQYREDTEPDGQPTRWRWFG